MNGEPEPYRDDSLARRTIADSEISRSWVYLSILAGLALALLTVLAAVVIPLPHLHHLHFVDAFNIAWKIAVLPPGAVTALIAVDRINLSKREHQHAVQDATQRRITELSAKANDQLGSDKATVRIGGLTDLERLGQNNPDLRQTVIDRICAYLQMPYTMPASGPPGNKEAAQAAPDNQATTLQNKNPELRQEKKVRLTAQRILIRHTTWLQHSPKPADFWPGLTLDLSDAALIDFNMITCCIGAADFTGTIFHGDTAFMATIMERAAFRGATFCGNVTFADTRFRRESDFSGATFNGLADFRSMTFSGDANFRSTTFNGPTYFFSAEFSEVAEFPYATFNSLAQFSHTSFNGATTFHDATFVEEADFSESRFGVGGRLRTPAVRDGTLSAREFFHGADFSGTAFNGEVDFSSTTFPGCADFDGTTFGGEAKFRGTTFDDEVYLKHRSAEREPVTVSEADLLSVDPVSRHLRVQVHSVPPGGTPSPA